MNVQDGLTQVSFWHHVTVPNGSHGDDGPPQSHRDGVEVIVRVVLEPLCVVHECGEYDYKDSEKEDQEEKLLQTGSKCVDEDLQARIVARKLKEAHDAHNGEELEDLVFRVNYEHLGKELIQVKREEGKEINDVDCRAEEGKFGVSYEEPEADLKSEPDVADDLDVVEDAVRPDRGALDHPQSLHGPDGGGRGGGGCCD